MQPRSQAVPLLQLFALTAMVIPSNTVIKAIGAGGYPAALVGTFAFAMFLLATVLGHHDPLRHRTPVRAVLIGLWLATLASYITMDRATAGGAGVTAADRMLMQLAVMSGVILVAAECLTSLDEVRRVLRALVWGGAFCGAVAALQFWASLDLTPFLHDLPGFTPSYENAGMLVRGGLNRVTGTAVYPIELGVVTGMLLPLAIFVALYDVKLAPRWRWTPVLLIALSIPASVSRSAVLAAVASMVVLVVMMPAPQRLVAIAAAPFAVVAVFMTAHGLIGTLASLFTAGTTDSSVATRVIDYPHVEHLVKEAPWFGHGGGTYLPADVLDVLDNQYLKTAIELGLVGLAAVVLYFAVPFAAALVARRASRDPELRLLCAALAGADLAAMLAALTFDALWYPMFFCVHALVLGLIGACWRLAAAECEAGAAREG